MPSAPLPIDYFSDLLCVWAYVAEVRVDELRRRFEGRVQVMLRFVPVFGDVAGKMQRQWNDRGGVPGYARHVREVIERFDHVELHPGAWTDCVPTGSLSAHASVKAAQLAAEDGDAPAGAAESLAWALRRAFFAEGRDPSQRAVRREIVGELELPLAALEARIDDGRAWAALAADHEAARDREVSGSPTFLMNSGRQKLYGNVGYRVLDANVEELLRDNRDVASWC